MLEEKQESKQTAGKPGPHTPAGKTKASGNARKHGGLADRILPEEGEAARKLVRGFERTLLPQGPIEKAEVFNLVMDYVRLHRIDRFDAAQTAAARLRAMLESTEKTDARQLRSFFARPVRAEGENIENLNSAPSRPCLTLLEKLARSLRNSLGEPEWDPDTVLRIIDQAYGSQKSPGAMLVVFFCNAARVKRGELEEEHKKRGNFWPGYFEGLVDVANHKLWVLAALQAEIVQVKATAGLEEILEAQACGENATSLPPDSVLDRVMRYRAANERSIDRRLDRLLKLRELRDGAKHSNDNG